MKEDDTITEKYNMKLAINPELVRFARNHLDLSIDDASALLRISPQLLQDFEEGIEQPDGKALQKMMKIYKRAFAFFFLPEAPKLNKESQDFRTINSIVGLRFHYKSNVAISKVYDLQSLAIEMSEHLDKQNEVSFPKITYGRNPEELANEFRKIQTKIGTVRLRSDTEAFDFFRNWVESMGVFVVQVPMIIDDARGFAIADEAYPIIAINQKDNYKSKNFTLLHELAHLMLGKTAVLYSSEEIGFRVDRALEKYCNRFAGAFLVPENDLLTYPMVKEAPKKHHWTDKELKFLSSQFFISKEVILRRFLDLGMVDADYYNHMRDIWEEERRNFVPLKIKMKRDFARECFRNYGRKLLNLTLQVYEQNKISPSDLYQYVNLRQKHLGNLKQMIDRE